MLNLYFQKCRRARSTLRQQRYVCSENPLHQQQKEKARQSQNADGQRVSQIQPQGNAGEGGGGIHRPQGCETQRRVDQQLQHQLQGGAEKPQQRSRRSRNRHRKPKSGEKKPVEAKEPPSEEKQPVKPRPKSSRGGRKPKAAEGVSVKAEAVPVEKKEQKPPQAKDAAQKKNNRRHYYRRGKPRNKQGGQPPKQ